MISRTIQFVKDRLRGIPLGGLGRSNQWPRVRKEFAKIHPICAVCGKTKIQVHHVKPFHLFPQLELDPSNFISLCEGLGTYNHHIQFGHLMNFKSFNADVREDAELWYNKIKNRPTVSSKVGE